jgi:hypothetical protein
MRPWWPHFVFFAGIACCLLSTGCRKSPEPAEPAIPPPDPSSYSTPNTDFSSKALEIHHAAQEMALDGFQFGKNNLAWPFDCEAATTAGYFKKLIDEGFLPASSAISPEGLRIANLSDSDPGETAFLRVDLPDKSLLFVRKDGKWAAFPDQVSAADFTKAPPREPAWLP